MLYAIVDIETTGSFASANGITEIAIVIHDGQQVLNYYESLVNPGQPIPYFIQTLTGITNEMVEHAPTFNEIAGQVFELLQDKVFVAHNVNFDYSFLKHQLQVAGHELDTRKLCTVRLARKILPGLRSYSLGKLCREVGINLTNQHRAGGDALATADLFRMLVENDTASVISNMLKGRNREQYLPPNLPVEQVDNLPKAPGVYYFYNNAGKIIYVGKAVNLSKRIKSHFSNNKINKQKQDFLREIYRISFKETATDLMAHILESTEIRRLWPVYNRSQRGYLPKYGLYVYEDRNGFKRLAIEKNRNHFKPVYTFNTIIEGHNRIREMISEFGLCARLCHIAKSADCENGVFADTCTGECPAMKNADYYNQKAEKAIAWMQQQLPTFALIDKGINENEQSCILIDKGVFQGMGYLKDGVLPETLHRLREQLEPMPDNDYIRNLVFKHAATFPEKCVIL